MTLTATSRPRRRSRARYTVAIPPWPISSSTSYLASWGSLLRAAALASIGRQCTTASSGRAALESQALQTAAEGALAEAEGPGGARLVAVGPRQDLGRDFLLEVVERRAHLGHLQHDRPGWALPRPARPTASGRHRRGADLRGLPRRTVPRGALPGTRRREAQLLDVDLVARVVDDEPFHQVGELAHVARPRVLLERAPRRVDRRGAAGGSSGGPPPRASAAPRPRTSSGRTRSGGMWMGATARR